MTFRNFFISRVKIISLGSILFITLLTVVSCIAYFQDASENVSKAIVAASHNEEVLLRDYTDFEWDSLVTFSYLPDKDYIRDEYGASYGAPISSTNQGLFIFCYQGNFVDTAFVNREGLRIRDETFYGNHVLIELPFISEDAIIDSHTCVK